jgi:cell division protein FtsZ
MTDFEFEIETEESSIIKVIGVGGGGSNAVNQMVKMNVKGVDFVICNTDAQALKESPVSIKIQLGTSLTEGRGAGNNPEKGREAAVENLADIEKILDNNTKMVFITAGMGGGTGTGAAPVIAEAAKKRGILTVGIVSIPFKIEGEIRIQQAIQGINKMREFVDALLIINNEKLKDLFTDQKFSEAFSRADDILAIATKGIAEIITVNGYINVDFEDVRTVMRDSGVALMGSAVAEGENRDMMAIKEALSSPLLKDNDIKGAKHILLNIMSATGEHELSMTEFQNITEHLISEVGDKSNMIWGTGYDDTLGQQLSVTVIATGFETYPGLYEPDKKKKIHVTFGQNLGDKDKNKEDNTVQIDPDIEGEQATIEFNIPLTKQESDKNNDKYVQGDNEYSEQPDKNKDNYKHVSDINKLNDSEFLDHLEDEAAILRKKRINPDNDE